MGVKAKGKASKVEGSSGRPDVFRYHDYRQLLKDWLAYLRNSEAGFSLRTFATQSGMSVSYVSMVLSGTRKLTGKASQKLAGALGLSPTERTYFELLTILGNSDSQEERLDAFQKVSRLRPYKRANPAENSTYQYLAHWYYVAIREMASLPDFKLDPEWIHARLGHPVELKEIERAVEFLVDHGYIEVRADGSIKPPTKSLDCQGGVYRLALTRFHREMFEVAARSIDTIPSDNRNLLGYTLAVDSEGFEKVRALLDETYRKIAEIARESLDADAVYHVEMALFPLTMLKAKGKEGKKK